MLAHNFPAADITRLGNLWRFDAEFAVPLLSGSEGELHPEGIKEIGSLIRDAHPDVLLTAPECEPWSWCWLVRGKGIYVGTLTKRLSKLLYKQHSIRASDSLLSAIGNVCRKYGLCGSTTEYVFRFVDSSTYVDDWVDGMHCDPNACYFDPEIREDARIAALPALEEGWGAPVCLEYRAASDDWGNAGLGRFWIAYPPPDSIAYGCAALWNHYGPAQTPERVEYELIRSLAAVLGLSYHRGKTGDVSFNGSGRGLLWVNAAPYWLGPAATIDMIAERSPYVESGGLCNTSIRECYCESCDSWVDGPLAITRDRPSHRGTCDDCYIPRCPQCGEEGCDDPEDCPFCSPRVVDCDVCGAEHHFEDTGYYWGRHCCPDCTFRAARARRIATSYGLYLEDDYEGIVMRNNTSGCRGHVSALSITTPDTVLVAGMNHVGLLLYRFLNADNSAGEAEEYERRAYYDALLLLSSRAGRAGRAGRLPAACSRSAENLWTATDRLYDLNAIPYELEFPRRMLARILREYRMLMSVPTTPTPEDAPMTSS